MPFLSENHRILTPVFGYSGENGAIKPKWFLDDENYRDHPIGTVFEIEDRRNKYNNRRAWLIDNGRLTFFRLNPLAEFYAWQGNRFVPAKKGIRIVGSYPFFMTEDGRPAWLCADYSFSIDRAVNLIEDIQQTGRQRRNERRLSRSTRKYQFDVMNAKHGRYYWRVFRGQRRLMKSGYATSIHEAERIATELIEHYKRTDRIFQAS